MADHTTGRKAVQAETAAALSQAVAAADAAAAGEQLPLFPVPIPARNARSGKEFDVAALQAAAEKRRGRPPGAVNKSTAKMREYLLARGVNPLEWFMRWLLVTPDELADYLGCTVKEALQEQRLMASELGPIFMPRMAPTDDAGKPVPMLNITIGGAAGGAAPGRKPWEYIVQDQELAVTVEPVDGDGSHGDEVTREAESETDQGGCGDADG
jgi:hypothetical protein